MGTVWTKYLDDHVGSSMGAVVLDSEFRVRAASQSVLDRGGFTADELAEMSALDLVHPDDLERAAHSLVEVYSPDDDRGEGLYRIRIKGDGQSVQYEPFGLQVQHVPDADDIVVMQFNEPSPALKALELSEDMVRAVRTLSGDFSIDGVVAAVHRMAERQMPSVSVLLTSFSSNGTANNWARGHIDADVIAENASSHPLALPEYVDQAIERFDRNNWMLHRRIGYQDPSRPQRIVFALLDDHDTLMGYVQIFASSDKLPTETEWLVYGSMSQILQAALVRHRSNEAMRFAADHDPLTELLNRRGLFDAAAKCQHHERAGLFLVDLDNFSWVNNSLGHEAGDNALVSVAECLRANCPPDAVIARMGGDEFVVVVPNLASEESLRLLSEDVCAKLVMPLGARDRRRTVRASIGAVVVGADETIEQAIARADIAMYDAKRRGGDRVTHA